VAYTALTSLSLSHTHTNRSTVNSFVPSINPFYTGYRRDKHRSFETFAAHKGTVTVALLAPAASLQLRAPHAHDGRARETLLPAAAPTRAAAALLQVRFQGFQGWGQKSFDLQMWRTSRAPRWSGLP